MPQPVPTRIYRLTHLDNLPATLQHGLFCRNHQAPTARAMLLTAMRAYSALGYSLSLIEVQKLAYFLQRLDEPLKLKFEKAQYGPFAHNLSFVLQLLDGTFLRGMAYKEAKPFAELTLIEAKFSELEAYNAQHLTDQQKQRVARLTHLIEGFESPLGMELLATTDYLLTTQEAHDLPTLIQAVEVWNPRKRQVLTPTYLRLAYERLISAAGQLQGFK